LAKVVKYYILIDDAGIALYNYVGLLVNLEKCVKKVIERRGYTCI